MYCSVKGCLLELFRTRIMFGFKAILYLVGFFLLVGITEARHIPVVGDFLTFSCFCFIFLFYFL